MPFHKTPVPIRSPLHRFTPCDWTTLYAMTGAAFAEVPMPELIWVKMKGRADAKTVLAARVPIRWTKAKCVDAAKRCGG